MSTVKIIFSNKPSDLLQTGDLVLRTPKTSQGGFSVNTGNVTRVGTVKDIYHSSDTDSTPPVPGWRVEVNTSVDTEQPEDTDYFFFVKNSNINVSGVSGYYAEVNLTNDSSDKASIFSVGSSVFETSK